VATEVTEDTEKDREKTKRRVGDGGTMPPVSHPAFPSLPSSVSSVTSVAKLFSVLESPSNAPTPPGPPMRTLAALTLALLAASPAAAADDAGWIDLTPPKSFDAFQPPKDAKDWAWAAAVTLDSKNPRKLAWTGDGPALVNGPGRLRDLITKESFGDAEIHLEFLIAQKSNAGVKMHGHYEIQIRDSRGEKKLTGDSCGGVYPRAVMKPKYHHVDEGIAPKLDAAQPAGEWQTLDIVFLAPRFDSDGKKTANAKLVKVELNGQVVHENVELKTPTGHAPVDKETARGPILLQADHGPVAFRNVRVRPLK
jgi:hypothetical protein